VSYEAPNPIETLHTLPRQAPGDVMKARAIGLRFIRARVHSFVAESHSSPTTRSRRSAVTRIALAWYAPHLVNNSEDEQRWRTARPFSAAAPSKRAAVAVHLISGKFPTPNTATSTVSHKIRFRPIPSLCLSVTRMQQITITAASSPRLARSTPRALPRHEPEGRAPVTGVSGG
jgi:hypothetical protein